MIDTCQERLETIVETAYGIVCQKIAGGSIEIYNEASLQLHLGSILKNLGQLYEFSINENGIPERFVIELEKSLNIGHTAKSNGKARCDIALEFVRGDKTMAQAFLELKYFKKFTQGNGAEATKDNRFGLFMDMENLEMYRDKYRKGDQIPLCYEIAIAENKTYSDPDSKSTIKTGNGCWTDDSREEIEGKGRVVHYVSHEDIDLKGNYKFEWTNYSDNHYCLLVKMQ